MYSKENLLPTQSPHVCGARRPPRFQLALTQPCHCVGIQVTSCKQALRHFTEEVVVVVVLVVVVAVAAAVAGAAVAALVVVLAVLLPLLLLFVAVAVAVDVATVDDDDADNYHNDDA